MNSLPGANWLFKLQMLQSIQYYSDVTQLVQDSAKWGTSIGPDSFGLLAKGSGLGFPFSAVFQHCPVQWHTHAPETLLKAVIWVQKMVVYASGVLCWYGHTALVCMWVHSDPDPDSVRESSVLCATNFPWLPKFPPASARFTQSMDVNGSFIQGLCWVKDFAQWRYDSFLVTY